MFGLGALLGLAGSFLGGSAEDSAENRQAQLEALAERERLKQSGEMNLFTATAQREQMRREAEDSGWKRLMQAQHVAGGGSQALNLSPYSRPLSGPTDYMRRVASDPEYTARLRTQAHGYDPFSEQRLGGALPNRPDLSQYDQRMNPGAWERIAGIGSGLLGGWGALLNGRSGGLPYAGRAPLPPPGYRDDI